MASGQLDLNKNDINRNNTTTLHVSAGDHEQTKNHLPFLIGELALDGRLNAVNGSCHWFCLHAARVTVMSS